jgi:outer membrane lipopolysaccharide assembly protein LptE/RlpB
MFDLTFRVIYEVQNPKGDILIPEKELMVRREYFNTQGSPLGQGLEEVQIRSEMEMEAAQTLLRQVVFTLRDKPAHPS